MSERQPRMRSRTIDLLVVVAVAAVALIGLTVGHLAARPEPALLPVPALAVLAVAQAAVLWWRRSQPLLVLAATLGLMVLAQAVDDMNAASFLGPHVAAYSVAAYGRGRLWPALGIMGAAGLADGAVIRWTDNGPAVAVLLGPPGVLVLAAWGIGSYVRVRREHLVTLQEYARHLEIERDQRAAEAVHEERRRIARELHDQVAHHLGVVSLQTSAARRWLQRDPERTDAALRSAEDAARRALTTMPTILRALRTDELTAELQPQPGLGELEELVEQVRATGLTVELSVHGPVRTLHPAVELTAFRVVQEALTNVMKHAGEAAVTVDLRYAHDQLQVDVTDDGHGAAANSSPGGHGLIGMHERVGLVGGRLSAGPRPGGGFSVSASLPTSVPAGTP